MEFLTYEAFRENAERNYKFEKDGKATGHWKADHIDARWAYHAQAIEIVRQAGVADPEKVLEMGTMGAQLVNGSHTIDYDESWDFAGFNPTYLHDVRRIPWPIQDKQYEWLIALRVFHHLWPVQRECLDEARRVARNVLLLVPSSVDRERKNRVPRTDEGITPLQIKSWNDGYLPRKLEKSRYGYVYWLSEQDAALPRSSRDHFHYYLQHILATSRRVVGAMPRPARQTARRLLNRTSSPANETRR